MKYFFVFLLLCQFISIFSQTKHALLIGVGKYPDRTDVKPWSDLSSKNDIDLVKTMLKNQKFD